MSHLPGPSRIVTTSWDDGHPAELRVAEALRRHGLAATMYMPSRCDHPVCTRAELNRLRDLGCELGGHTLTHARLDALPAPEALRELVEGKAWLEDACGQEVSSFAYTWGRDPRRVRALVRQAGFVRARTLRSLRTDWGLDPMRIPVTVQLYPHPRGVHLRHALKEGNWRGLASWGRMGFPAGPLEVLARAVERVERCGGVIHLWGHGWEVEQHDLWDMLEQAATLLGGRAGWQYLTNGATDRLLRGQPQPAA